MNAKITFVELVDLMAEATSTSKRMCELFLRELIATLSQALIDGESVKIKGIGTFKVTTVKPRKSVNVASGEVQEIDSRAKLTFTPDKSLAEAVNQPFAHFETVFLDDGVTDDALEEIDKQYPSYFPETEDLPEPPDMPLPPAPDSDLIPASRPVPDVAPAHSTATTAPAAGSAEPKHSAPAMATPVEHKTHKKVEPLMGTPIDDPEAERHESKPAAAAKPAPEPEPEPMDRFYRPAPRNAYTPTQEQIEESHKHTDYKRWGTWGILGLLALGLIIWLFARGDGQTEVQQEIVLADTVQVDDNGEIAQPTDNKADKKDLAAEKKAQEEKAKAEKLKQELAKAEKEKAERAKAEKAKAEKLRQELAKAEKAAEPAQVENKASNKVVTDVVTDKIVLVTLAEKYYGSPWFWVYIYDENRDKISNPNNIKPGTRVVIPPASKYGINAKNAASVKKAQRLSWEYLKPYQ